MTNGDDFPSTSKYRLTLNGGWEFLEWLDFGRQYVQVYSLVHALLKAIDDGHVSAKLTGSGVAPWRGGWSAANFFTTAIGSVDRQNKPRLSEIQYASPGYIELFLDEQSAQGTKRIIDAVCYDTSKEVRTEYNLLHREASKRGLLRKSARGTDLNRDDEQFCLSASRTMIRRMRLEEYGTGLDEVTGGNPLAVMKVIFAIYRRVMVLADLQDNGKVSF